MLHPSTCTPNPHWYALPATPSYVVWMACSNQGETVANAIKYGGNRAFLPWGLSLSHSSPCRGLKSTWPCRARQVINDARVSHSGKSEEGDHEGRPYGIDVTEGGAVWA